jgi:glycosyltransferase involved in cell wall biosynthesis
MSGLHVAWISDSPDTPSGFGNVTRYVCEGLARRGHRVSILGWQTKQACDWNGCRVLPMGRDPLGGDALYAYLLRHRPDAVIALADVWWLPYFAAPHVRRQLELTETPWILYFPVDGNTADGGLPQSWAELLREVDVPVAMSRYGSEVAARCGVDSTYIPHGVDLEAFAPPPDREAVKRSLGLGGSFVVLSDSRNQPRKLLPRLLDVFARFAEDRPDAVLHLHTDPDDEFAASRFYSYDVRADVAQLGLDGKVRFTPGFAMRQSEGLPIEELARYYQAADVHLLASSGEGFGLPSLQAAAAGAVPMASAYSASRELVEGHGEAIEVADWGETEFGIRRALIDVDDAVAKLAHLYEDRDELRRRSERSREFSLGYGWDEVIAEWDRLLVSIAPRRLRPLGAAWWARDRGEATVERELVATAGTSITVRMVQREFGRLEASIGADARESSDVRLPTVPRACEVGAVRVPRRPGAVCAARGDALVLLALQRIFPILEAVDELDRFELAQAVLVLNVSGGLTEDVLVDAALFGVPCVGTDEAEPQTVLWPELATQDPLEAVSLARDLLTNPGRARRATDHAREVCHAVYAPTEHVVAAELRERHALRQAAGAR